MESRQMIGRARRVLALWAAVLLCTAARLPAYAGDPDVAKILLEQGRKALEKGDATDGLTKLHRARTEDPELLEATYWIAHAHEKQAQRASAVEEYRAFVGRLEALESVRSLARAELGLLKTARARLDVLDAGMREIAKSNAGFADRLMKFAESMTKKDPGLAQRALRMLLELSPAHLEAQQLLGVLTGGGAAGEGFLTALDDRWDLIRSSAFGTLANWKYDSKNEKVEITSQPKGSLSTMTEPIDAGPHFAIAVDVELLAQVNPAKQPVFGVGFGFATGRAGGIVINAISDSISIDKAGSGQFERGKGAPVETWAVGGIRSIQVLVEGKRVRVTVNGAQLLEETLDEAPSGGLAIFYENVRVRLHKFVLARPEGRK